MTLPDSVSQAARWLLVVGLAFFCADTTAALIQKRLQVPPKPLPQTAVGEVQEDVPAQAAPPGLVSLLRTTKPEGADETPATKAGGNTNPSIKPAARKAPSNLKLRGTMAGVGGSGLAMIDVNGKTQVVSTGEQISGLTLTSVTAYSVRLEANGQIQLLEMDSGTQLAGAPTVRQPVQRIQPKPETTPEPEQEADSGAILTKRELRDILDNPAAFAGKGFRMKPVLKGGEIIGMRVSIRDASHPLARLGIKNGDVVRSLNGTPLNGPEALSSIYRVLRNTSNLSFDVDRGGSNQKVEVQLDD